MDESLTSWRFEMGARPSFFCTAALVFPMVHHYTLVLAHAGRLEKHWESTTLRHYVLAQSQRIAAWVSESFLCDNLCWMPGMVCNKNAQGIKIFTILENNVCIMFQYKTTEKMKNRSEQITNNMHDRKMKSFFWHFFSGICLTFAMLCFLAIENGFSYEWWIFPSHECHHVFCQLRNTKNATHGHRSIRSPCLPQGTSHHPKENNCMAAVIYERRIPFEKKNITWTQTQWPRPVQQR